MKWKKIEGRILPFTLFLSSGKPQDIFAKVRRCGLTLDEQDAKRICDITTRGATAQLSGKRGTHLLVWIPQITNKAGSIALLVHELLHVTNHVFFNIGITEGIPDIVDEIHAYFLEYLTEEALKFYLPQLA